MRNAKRPILITILVCAVMVPVCSARSRRGKAKPVRMSVLEILDKYAETQDRLKSFIIKSEGWGDSDSSFFSPNKPPSHFSHEIRFDGNRTNIRTQKWGGINNDIYTTKDKPLYRSRLWDGKTFFQHDRNTYNPRGYPGTVIITKSKKINDKYKRGKITIHLSTDINLMGILLNDAERVDSVLRKADTITVRDETESIGGTDCYVIEADTKHGEYTIWIDPEHGYNIAKAITKRGPGDVVFHSDYILPEKDRIYSSLENIRFKKVDDVWVPVEVDIRNERNFPDGRFHKTRSHYKRTEIILNPEFNDSDFVPDDIPNGAKVYIKGVRSIKYTWQDGKVVDKKGRVVFDSKSKKTSRR